MPEKALKMLLNIYDNFRRAAKAGTRPTVSFKVRILQILFSQVINKHQSP